MKAIKSTESHPVSNTPVLDEQAWTDLKAQWLPLWEAANTSSEQCGAFTALLEELGVERGLLSMRTSEWLESRR